MRQFDNLYCVYRRYHDNQSRMLWATSHYERYILEKLNNLRYKYRDATEFDHILVVYFGDSATELDDNFEVKKN